MSVIACIGHWYVSLLYLAPVAAVVGGLWVSSRRNRKAQEAEDAMAELEAAATGPDAPAAVDRPLVHS
jgi:cytochrome c-type biogenesis protein CcmH/NrfF